MAIQAATTGSLENAQNIVIAAVRYTAEHNAPCVNLIEHFTLGQGNKQLTIPKVGQYTFQNLTDGVDLVDTQDIGLTSVDLTTAEVGARIILTYKLLRQFNEDVFKMVGRQAGDAAARKKNEDIIALFSALNGGTTLGADNVALSLNRASGCVAFAKANKFPSPISAVHHPNAVAALGKDAAGVGTTYFAGVIEGLPTELVRNYWKIKIGDVNWFETGDIAKIAAVDSGYGAIFSKSAMAILESLAYTVERDQDISLRAWELVFTADYGVYEIDDGYGAPLRYEIGNLDTT